jgi:hypothetical protein
VNRRKPFDRARDACSFLFLLSYLRNVAQYPPFSTKPHSVKTYQFNRTMQHPSQRWILTIGFSGLILNLTH